jgi:uncharacterized repeat protein (TIGR04138 family)
MKNLFSPPGRVKMFSMDQTMLDHIEKIVATDMRYRTDAYSFVMEALAHAQKTFHRERHITGGELLLGVRDLAVKKFGAFAFTVFRHWGVCTTEDVGHIVFNLVDSGLLGRRDEDTFDDFRNVFDMEEALGGEYRRQLERSARRIR